MNQSMEKATEQGQKIVLAIKQRRGLIGTLLILAVIIGVALWVKGKFDRAADYDKLKEENDALQASVSEMSHELENLEKTKASLEHAEQQVKLLEQSTSALKGQVGELNALNEELNNQIDELLNIQESVPKITRNELEAQINSLSELVTKRYWYRNATQKDSDKTWLWGWTMPFSDVSLLATYDGTITTSIDLKQVKFSINDNSNTITVTMPQSKIFDHNIPQETINVLQVKNNLFNSISFNDYNQFISAEKIVMEEVAIEQGLLTEADKEALEVVKAFLEQIPGMENYTLKFEQAK